MSIDTMETYFDSHVDLLQRRLQKHSDRLKMKAEETFKMRDLSGDLLAENFEKEVKNFKLKVCFNIRRSQHTTSPLDAGRTTYEQANYDMEIG